ncbi:hypothetical protein AeMF1_009440 [Aphanomyces euteiches]|nr:hypothetical protein AeMF1_009440 [Aphanomyces euteiches]KAH9196746.1 hypothetical protein AeNC1_001267 [Aphanomyces euteiches]
MSAKPATEDTVVGLDQPYVDVNGNGAPVKGGGGGGGASAAAGSSAVSLKATIALGLVIFALLQLIALWVLTFVYHIPVDAVQLSTSSFGGSTDQRALSFAPGTSTLRVGAGTTAYLDAATLPSDTMHYVQLAPTTSAAPSNVAVFSYYLPDKSQTAVTVVRVKSDKSVSIDAVDAANTVTNQIRGLATLSDSTTVALEQTSLGNVFVTPISTVGQTVSVQTSKRVAVATGSVSNVIGATSSSQFVVAYFEQYAPSTNYYQRLVGGSVGSDGTITLSSTPLQFGTANYYGNSSQSTTFGKPTTVSSVANAFLLPWWSSTTTSNPGLCIFQGAVGSNGDVTKTSETCSTKYLPANFVDSTVISATSILLAFHDSNNNNEFTLVIVEASASKVFFKSSFIVSGAGGSYNFGSFYSWYPRPVVSLVSSTRVAVALFNPSSQGRPYTQVFALTDAGSVKPVTPLLPLADSSFTLAGPANSAAASGAVMLAIVPVSSEAFLVSYAGKLSTMASPKRLSLVEFYGPVAGIGKGSKGLIVNGVASVGGGLTSGMSYYTTTKGDVVSVTSTDPTADYFVSGTSTVVSADSRLGVAVDDKSIYVTARAA